MSLRKISMTSQRDLIRFLGAAARKQYSHKADVYQAETSLYQLVWLLCTWQLNKWYESETWVWHQRKWQEYQPHTVWCQSKIEIEQQQEMATGCAKCFSYIAKSYASIQWNLQQNSLSRDHHILVIGYHLITMKVRFKCVFISSGYCL